MVQVYPLLTLIAFIATSHTPSQIYGFSIIRINEQIKFHDTPLLFSTLSLSNDDLLTHNNIQPIDNRPHEQRVDAPRHARRLNHAFQHLYRHSDPRWDDNDWDADQCNDVKFQQNVTSVFGSMDSNSTIAERPLDRNVALSAIHYLHVYGGYSLEQIRDMHASFPPLFEIDVVRHLRPKMRFLKDCMDGGVNVSTANSTMQVLCPELKAVLPASFFGARFERTIAPRHAFLVHVNLPNGKTLWETVVDGRSLFEEFLMMHRKPKQFAAMCNAWKSIYSPHSNSLPITAEQIVAFDKLFQRGMLSAARNDTSYIFPDERNKQHLSSGPCMMKTANVTTGQLIRYLIQHGGNPYEEDVRGASLFHWAAGCGNLEALQELVTSCNELDFDRMSTNETQASKNSQSYGALAALLWKASRDDATPLHWAAAGAGVKEFGVGGHASIVNYLLLLRKQHQLISERKLINSLTKDGNSVLMWAAWSQSLDVVKLLVRNRADTHTTNRNGCTVAHWSSSGGSVAVCKYLAEIAHVDYSVENYHGNTPLSHAVAYARASVVRWLKEDMSIEDRSGSAADLATNFVDWGSFEADEEIERRKVFDLFQDWRQEMGEDVDPVR